MCNRKETKNPPGGFILDASFVSPETFAFRLGRFERKIMYQATKEMHCCSANKYECGSGTDEGFFLNVHIIKESDEHKHSAVLIDRQSRSTRAYTVLFDAADILYNAEGRYSAVIYKWAVYS
jgi:hypothetical protein